jgi:hypothetical protein
MENCDRRHCRYPISAELCQLLTVCTVHINKSVHITDADLLEPVLRMALPLGP